MFPLSLFFRVAYIDVCLWDLKVALFFYISLGIFVPAFHSLKYQAAFLKGIWQRYYDPPPIP